MSSKLSPLTKITQAISHVTETDKTDAGAPAQSEPSWLRYVAVLTGVLAALAGFLTVRSTILTNEAIYQSNQAILSQTQASDAWAEYQADSIKARVVETQLLPSVSLSVADKAQLTKEDNDIRERQPKSKQLAQDKEKERESHLGEGMKRLEEKDLLGYAGMCIQLAIALASVAALVKIRPLFHVSVVVGIIGIFMTAYALLVHYFAKG